MLDPGLMELKGAHTETRYTTLATVKFISGLATQRSPFAGIDTRYGTRFLGGKPDSLIAGSNVEISNKLTLQRRPGLVPYGVSAIPVPLTFFEWESVAPFNLSLVVDTAPAVYTYSPTAAAIWFNKATKAQTNFLGLANTLYLGDGADLLKITGPNLLFFSNTFNQFSASGLNGWHISLIPTITPGKADPIGGLNATRLTWSNPSQQLYQIVTPNVTPVGSNTFTISLWVKFVANAGTVQFLLVNQSLGIISQVIITPTGTWQRYQVTGTMGPGDTGVGLFIGNPSVNNLTIDIYGAQLEPGGPATATQITTIKPQGIYNWGIVGPTSAPAVSFLTGQTIATTVNIINISQPGPVTTLNTFSNNPSNTQALVTFNNGNFNPTTFGFVPGALFTMSNAVPAGYNSVGNLIGSISATGLTTFVVYTPNPNLGAGNTGSTIRSQLTTVTTATPHTLVVGQSVTIAGTGVAGYNGTFTVFNVIDAFNFTFNATTAGNAAATTGTTSGSFSNGFSPTTGYTYSFAYLNSVTGQPSNESPVVVTGILANKQITLTGPRSSDPQVDQVVIYRNTDGGAFRFQLAVIANPTAGNTWQYTDGVPLSGQPNANLNTSIYAPIGGLNTPPPAGALDPVEHASRTWLHVNNLLYYSALQDNATPLNVVLNGVSAECWPPLNNIPFDAPVTRKISTAAGLLVWTTKDLWIVIGTTVASPFNPSKILIGHGLRNWNALDVDGSSLWAYVSDRQFLNVNPGSGSLEVGFPIGDTLEGSLDPNTAYVARHVAGSQDNAVFLADGSTGWYRLNPNQVGASLSGEQTELWSTLASIVGGAGAVASIETSPGIHQLLVGQTTTGPILVRSLTTFSDNGIVYPWSATIGSIVLATPGSLAETESITTEMVASNGTQCAVAVLLDEITGNFESLPRSVNDPPQLAPSVSILSNRFYLSQGTTPPVCRHLQIKLSGSAATTKDELLALSIRGALVPEEV